jgi:hypothetical protein
MLRVLARHELESGNYPLAASFASAAHTTQPQRENSRLLDELKKAGHSGTLPASPWRFAPYAPLIVLALFLGVIGVKAMRNGATPETSTPAPQAPVARATHPTTAPTSTQEARTAEDVGLLSAKMSGDELEKRLRPDSSESVARRYVGTRLRELKGRLESTIRSGESLASMELTIKGMEQYPAVARALEKDALRKPYESLTAAVNLSMRYYHGGAPVEAVERTAGELLPVALDVTLASLDAEEMGHTERSDALANEAGARAASLYLMKRDLRVRAAVLTLLTRELDTTAKAAGSGE